ERAVGIEVDVVIRPGAVSSDWTGVDVAIHQQLLSVAAGVAHGEYLVVGDFPLHAQVVIVRSRCLEVLRYREGVEWRRSRGTGPEDRTYGGAVETGVVAACARVVRIDTGGCGI